MRAGGAGEQEERGRVIRFLSHLHAYNFGDVARTDRMGILTVKTRPKSLS